MGARYGTNVTSVHSHNPAVRGSSCGSWVTRWRTRKSQAPVSTSSEPRVPLHCRGPACGWRPGAETVASALLSRSSGLLRSLSFGYCPMCWGVGYRGRGWFRAGWKVRSCLKHGPGFVSQASSSFDLSLIMAVSFVGAPGPLKVSYSHRSPSKNSSEAAVAELIIWPQLRT